jgi:hypothetical protein
MKKIPAFLFILFFASCGYQPIYLKNESKTLEVSNIILEGERDINSRVLNSISVKVIKTREGLNQLKITNLLTNQEISKNSKGQIISLRSTLKVNLSIFNNDTILENKDFTANFTYSNKSNKSELVNYQKEIKTNLINAIVKDINLYLNFR